LSIFYSTWFEIKYILYVYIVSKIQFKSLIILKYHQNELTMFLNVYLLGGLMNFKYDFVANIVCFGSKNYLKFRLLYIKFSPS
jgi:hypothetical protein